MKKLLLSLCFALVLTGCITSGGGSPKTGADAVPQYKSEAGIMMVLGDQSTVANAQSFPIIFSSEAINVKTYRDAEESLGSFKTYDFDYTNKTNPLLEKELFGQLEKALQARGLSRVTKDPQITISMDFFIGKKEQYTPPNTVTSTEIKYVWTSAAWGWNVGGYNQAVPVTSSTTTAGYTTTSYYTNIRLNFLNRAKLLKGAKLETPPMIWLGEADNEGMESDIRGIAPVMFNELAGEFPDQTSKPAKRFVRLFRFGGLGLGFAPADWRQVLYVEPSSVAAESGIKPGDFILKINGESAGTYIPQSFWYVSNPANYRLKDPYYLNILSNKGDKDVEVLIKSAETGEKVTLKMRPRNGDRYIYVDQYGQPL